MLQITCPYCGQRDETEFQFGGEAHIIRPPKPSIITDEEWTDYLYFRDNPKGVHYERWRHLHGCGQWFNMARNTVTHEILNVYAMGEFKPKAMAAE